jgi:hypothetical protein
MEEKLRKKGSMEYPEHLKQVENNKKWKEWTELKPGTKGVE